MKKLTGYYLKHYEYGIRDLLTTYADPNDVVVHNGKFSVTLNPMISAKAVDSIIYRLENVQHVFW